MERQPAVYIMANKCNGTLYVGVTSNLVQRVWQHKQRFVDGFCKRYTIDLLVYFELHQMMMDAIAREKQIKGGSRAKKIQLIESINPQWLDLYVDLL